MAVPARNEEMEVPEEWSRVQMTAAELLGHGKTRAEVADLMERHLITANQRAFSPRRRRYYALRKLRKWQKQKGFRDLVWANAVERTDRQAPDMIQGVVERAKNGRVDAAKFALEVAGRYTPKGHDQPTAVQIVVNGVPRPAAQIPTADVVDGQIVAEED